MADWEPPRGKPVVEPDTSGWEPPRGRVPVKAHSRGRSPIAEFPLISTLPQGPTVSQAVHALPVVAGIAGSRFGAPGATIAGGLGTAVSLLLERAMGEPTPENWRDFRMAVERGAVGQGGAAALGTALSSLAQAGGRAVMRAGLLPGKSLAGFPDVARTALEEVIPQGPLFRGAAASGAARSGAAAAEDALLAKAASAGTRFTVDDLAREALARVARNAGRPLSDIERLKITQQVGNEARRILSERTLGAVEPPGTVFEPWQVKIIKQDAQDTAGAYLKAQRAGTAAAGDPGLMSDLAQGARRQLTTIKGWEPLAKRTQSLIGLSRAAAAREAPGSGVGAVGYGTRFAARGGLAAAGAGAGAMIPGSPERRLQHAAEGAAVGGLLGSPELLSLIALGMNYPLSGALRYLPQILAPQLQQVGAP